MLLNFFARRLHYLNCGFNLLVSRLLLQKKLILNRFNVHGSVHRNNIVIYIQQDATLHSLFYLETALNVSGGTSTHHQVGK